MSVRRSLSSSLFTVPLSLAVMLGLSTAACSSGLNVAEPAPASLSCCRGGVIYKCSNEEALDHCSTAGDTTNCAKTVMACGDDGKVPTDPPPDAGPPPPDTTPPPTDTTPPPPAKKDVGEKCTAEADCAGGYCLVFGTGSSGFCSKACGTGSDCPSKYRCELMSSGGVKVCVPMGDKKLGETCTYNLDCASDLCVVVGSATTGYCTAPCTVAAECPAGWSCDRIGSASGKYCLSP